MISIVTPTYNRAYTLERLYRSIIEQNSDGFEWIVVDDGSNDNTKNIIDGYIKENKIIIKYIHQSNMGKPTAINVGVKNSSHDFIFIVDSDDAITPDAVKVITDSIYQLTNKKIPFSGVGFRRGKFSGGVIGAEYHESQILMLDATECSHLFKGDLAYCFKKKLHLSNPFPQFNGEKFVPELYIWNKITDLDKIAFYPMKIIYLCEYLEDGLSKNFKSQLKKNPKGFGVFYADQISREMKIKFKIKNFIRRLQCYLYECFK